MRNSNKTGRIITTIGCVCLFVISAHGQTRRKQQTQRTRSATSGTLTVKASLFYQFGGAQPAAGTEFLVLDTNPEDLMSCKVAVFAVASVLHESFTIAAARIQVALAQQSGSYYEVQQREEFLRQLIQTQTLRDEASYGVNAPPTADTDLEAVRRSLADHIIARALVSNYGVAILRGLPTGRELYLFGFGPTRGAAVVWLFSFTLKSLSETLVLDQKNALVAF